MCPDCCWGSDCAGNGVETKDARDFARSLRKSLYPTCPAYQIYSMENDLEDPREAEEMVRKRQLSENSKDCFKSPVLVKAPIEITV